jgi:hypothetical protein
MQLTALIFDAVEHVNSIQTGKDYYRENIMKQTLPCHGADVDG